MKNRFLRTAVILATAATIFSIGCGDKGESSDVRGDGNVKSLINRMRGTNDPKAPELYTLSVIKSPETGGSVSKSPDKEQYEKGESVMIIAAPGPDYRFTGWSGASSSTNTSVTITMDGNKNLTANFLLENVPSYTLNVIANPTNGGTVSKSPDKPEYANGETVYITATAETGYRFAGWSGSQTSTNTTMTVTMDGNKELVANFLTDTVTTHLLTVNPNPAAGGTVSKSPDKLDYATGESVLVTATPYDGYNFTGWSGASSSKDATVTINMDDSKELVANFAPLTYTLAINSNPSNGGSVSSDPGKSVYTYNEQVTVTATANPGYEFTGWSGALSSTSASVTVIMDGNKTLTAGFRQTGIVVPPSASYTLTVSASPSNGGTVSTNPYKTRYNANENVYVTTEAAEGYRFVGWSGASGSTNKSVTISMDSDKELIAIFEILTYTLTVNSNPAAGGSVSRNPNNANANYNHGTTVTITASANSGYRFTGWTGASTSTNTSVAIPMDGNKTLTANFEQIITYTVSFNANGGSGTVSSRNAQAGNSITLPDGSGLSMSGYRFDGWNTNSDGSGTNYNAGTVYTPTANVTMYARWDVVTYTITFNANNGTVSPTSGTTSADKKLASLPTPTRSDYIFVGWYTTSTGGTEVTTNTEFSANATIYARWVRSFTVTFNANGGTVSPTSSTTDASGMLTSLPTPTRTGYTFNDWYTVTIGGMQVTVTTSTVFSANAIIYARWTLVTYTITFNANNGTVSPTSGTTGEGGTLASLPIPTRTGYSFNGWFTAATGGTRVTTSTVFSANATIYAQWQWNPVFTDSRDGKTYNTVVAGGQTWMAKNLNYDVPNNTTDVCYGNSADSCAKYGRLYNWATAMNGASSSNLSPSGVQGVCPAGWHLPSDAEWTALRDAVGGAPTAGTKLKSTSGWYYNTGTDQYGWSALPGGGGNSNGDFFGAGYYGYWWIATEYNADRAYYWGMSFEYESVDRHINPKSYLFYVRCVQD